MLYRTLLRMIQRGQLQEMEEKLDLFCAGGKQADSRYRLREG